MTGFAVAHLLNCLFASCSVPSPHLTDEINSNQENKKGRKKKNKKGGSNNQVKQFEPNPAAIGWQRMTNEWMQVTPDSIWRDVEKRAKTYFRTNLESKSIDQVCSLYNIQKASRVLYVTVFHDIFRRVCWGMFAWRTAFNYICETTICTIVTEYHLATRLVFLIELVKN